MSQKRKQRAAAPRDLSFGAVQRKLAAKGAAAAAASSPRASKKTPLQIEKLIEKRLAAAKASSEVKVAKVRHAQRYAPSPPNISLLCENDH